MNAPESIAYVCACGRGRIFVGKGTVLSDFVAVLEHTRCRACGSNASSFVRAEQYDCATDRPCNLHPPPSTLGAIWCTVCGAWRPTLGDALTYVNNVAPVEGCWTRFE